jgi:hypothetical protein
VGREFFGDAARGGCRLVSLLRLQGVRIGTLAGDPVLPRDDIADLRIRIVSIYAGKFRIGKREPTVESNMRTLRS